MAFVFEKPEVDHVVDFADEIAVLTEGVPRGYGFLVDRLNRAALSIATNLAEGNGRFATPGRCDFVIIAREIVSSRRAPYETRHEENR